MNTSPTLPLKKVASAPESAPAPAAPKVTPPKSSAVSVVGTVKKARAKPTAATKITTPKRSVPKPKIALPTTLKVVRDGYSMPKNEYDALKLLKAQCLKHGASVKKSELLRAGLSAIVALSPAALIAAVQALPEVKTGRKKKAA